MIDERGEQRFLFHRVHMERDSHCLTTGTTAL